MTNLLTTFHQINLHKSKFANFELFKQLEPLSNFVALTQEPYVYKGKITGIPRGLKHHLVEPNARSCIIWPKKLNITPVFDFCSGDIVTCLWETNSILRTKLMLISVYWDILQPEVPAKLISCINYCSSNNIPYLCSMDSNAHSTLCGSPSDNPMGKILEELLDRGLIARGYGGAGEDRGDSPDEGQREGDPDEDHHDGHLTGAGASLRHDMTVPTPMSSWGD